MSTEDRNQHHSYAHESQRAPAVHPRKHHHHRAHAAAGVEPEPIDSSGPRGNPTELERTHEGKHVDMELPKDDPAEKFMKSFSILSAKTLGQLDKLEAALRDVENEVTKIEQDLISGKMSLGKGKDVLAQIEARLDKLQFNGIDSVETVDLHSGKEPAKAARKELVREAERLSARIDTIFKQIKAAEKCG
ncbi:60S acidic ribosomal protein p2, putative [Perkinsus marinus ATCC 50983]|uniref:60S acidic ribosomal protein p2, putative n=1 Tax=Perkinsus marinus (strain ATCC 50983 / TXsc) TaxID=423536 RepID=C5K725_PERM5|nr:60S acidic ribosomal protein p2, putative [Perkinsus marinus ATCC 50983]EER19360.1 60S acidic ribosomal protein p2, putative [Perkinsus marinus ATCC 50983]|eukprot:XP_002787564.1 60S acidic ribosomal protein p2, putative [Perkinsus marinus ATCC 50983]